MSFTAVVTGGTSGIGMEIARGLVRRGAIVVIGARDPHKGDAVRAELIREPGGGTIEIVSLDVSSMASVRQFASAVAVQHPTIQLLINNAGAWFNDRVVNRESHELTFATNVLGPYLLTHLLVPQLRAGTPARIVNVTSSTVGSYDASDLEWKRRKYTAFKAYMQSKQMMRMMTWTMAAQLAGTGVVANAVAPGIVKTDFLQNSRGLAAALLRLSLLFSVTPEKGAETPLWVALAPELADVSGRYFENHKEKAGKYREQDALDKLDIKLRKITSAPAITF